MSATCTCATPVPVVRADRKGAPRTECVTCGKPLALRLTGSRSAA